MENKPTTDDKIVFMVEHALKTGDPALLFRLADLLEKRATFENILKELTAK